jgi:hypothetical protein
MELTLTAVFEEVPESEVADIPPTRKNCQARSLKA